MRMQRGEWQFSRAAAPGKPGAMYGENCSGRLALTLRAIAIGDHRQECLCHLECRVWLRSEMEKRAPSALSHPRFDWHHARMCERKGRN